MAESVIVSDERIKNAILFIRGQKVLLDEDLAELYGVQTRVLNQAVKRNSNRFPPDFIFQLNNEEVAEAESLRSRFVILKKGRGQHRKYLPFAFTEHGVIMAASILNSQRAVEVSVYVVRVFVRLREMLAANDKLAQKLEELERKVGSHDETIRSLVLAIRQLMEQPEPERKEIGFRVK